MSISQSIVPAFTIINQVRRPAKQSNKKHNLIGCVFDETITELKSF